MKPTFKVGDRIYSTCDELMNDVWRATIAKVWKADKAGSSDGHCYITNGRWDGESATTKGGPRKITSRQLWAEHMALDD